MTTERLAVPALDACGVWRFRFPGPMSRGEPECFLSPRSAGPMTNAKDNANRRSFFSSLGVDPSRLMGLRLVHSRIVAFYDSATRDGATAEDPEADGAMTSDPFGVPCVTVADCMPIWLLDRGSGIFGVLHSGWKGTGILGRAMDLLEAGGAKPSDVAAVFGPAIGACCYRVDEERARSFAREHGEESVRIGADGSRSLDLAAANLAIARGRGIGHVAVVEACTACDDRFGSYRREGSGVFTRMAAFCGALEVA